MTATAGRATYQGGYCWMSCCDWKAACNPECPSCRYAKADHKNGEHEDPSRTCPYCRAEELVGHA